MKYFVLLLFICVSGNLVAGTIPAAPNKPLDITYESQYLKMIGFDKLYYFLNENTIKFTSGSLVNKSPTLEWSPNDRYLLLTDIRFGEKYKEGLAGKASEYQFLIIDTKDHSIKPYKLPVYETATYTNLTWFNDSELAITGEIEGGKLRTEDGIDNVVVFDLNTGNYKDWKLPDFDRQDIGCLDFVKQVFFNQFTKQVFVRFDDSEACGGGQGNVAFNPDKSGQYDAALLKDDGSQFNGIALEDGTILNGKYVSTSSFKMKPTKYSLVHHYCEKYDGCAFNKDMQYANIQRDNTIRLGKYSYPPPQASSYTLETSGYIIKLQSDCKDGEKPCNKFIYYGKSKKNGNSITLHGTRTKFPCYEKLCAGKDFVFRKGDYTYVVTTLGHLSVIKSVLKGKKPNVYEMLDYVLDEDGVWR